MSTSMSLRRAIAFAAIAATSTFAFPQSSTDPRAYQQCGGIGYAGATTCPPGFPCTRLNDYFSMCYPPATTATTSSATTTPIVTTTSSIKITTTTNTANTRSYQQCGGIGYAGPTECPSDFPCTRFNDYFSTCGPSATTSSTRSTTTISSTTTSTTTSPTTTTTSTTTPLPSRAYAQCGGQGYNGPTTCPPGYPCQRENDYFSNCLPVTTTSSISSITTTPPPTTTSSSLSTTKSCASTVCQDFINSCGQTYGGCYPYCSGFTRPTFTPPPCTTTTRPPPTTTKPPATSPPSTSATTKCTQTLCEDFINSCGRIPGMPDYNSHDLAVNHFQATHHDPTPDLDIDKHQMYPNPLRRPNKQLRPRIRRLLRSLRLLHTPEFHGADVSAYDHTYHHELVDLDHDCEADELYEYEVRG
nr:hypothetical protein B0A51_13130 [Rachicladosporium sp. CCFEE 5018]